MTPKKKSTPEARLQPKRIEWDDPAAVDEFLRKCDHPLKAVMAAVRTIILSADRGITEGIKWNAPSFYRHGWFATFNARGPDTLLIVFHQGAKVRDAAGFKIEDPIGLLQWLAKDRAIAKFSGLPDLKAKKAALQSVVGQWAKQMPDTSDQA